MNGKLTGDADEDGGADVALLHGVLPRLHAHLFVVVGPMVCVYEYIASSVGLLFPSLSLPFQSVQRHGGQMHCVVWFVYLPLTCKACARGEPPPQGMVSRRVLAMAMERVGGRST